MQQARESFHVNMPDVHRSMTAFRKSMEISAASGVKMWRAIQTNRKLKKR
jgi:hypothetical protein